jgi:gamma-glutamylaminecyclotransferase
MAKEAVNTHLVFVYGTLKKTYGNNRLLQTSEFLGEDTTIGDFRMKQVGFPAVWKAREDDEISDAEKPFYGKVSGEVYRVTDEVLERLDNLESNGRMYQREQVLVESDDNGDTGMAWMYIATPSFWKQIENYPDIMPNEEGIISWPMKTKAQEDAA